MTRKEKEERVQRQDGKAFEAFNLEIADAHRSDNRRFVVRGDEKLTAFVERTALLS